MPQARKTSKTARAGAPFAEASNPRTAEVSSMATHSVQQRDVEYLQQGDLRLAARLYQPEGTGPFPAVVEVHGGAWTSGDRYSNVAIDAALSAAGVVVLALEFRMPPDGVYPAPVADVNYAIRWLKAHASEFYSRADLVGGIATSSGAQTLLLEVLRPDDRRYAAIPLAESPATDACMSFVALGWPIADPLARYRMAKAKGNERLVASHERYWRDEAEMAEGSPQLILERGEAAKNLPPLLILQGTNDDNVTPEMADNFAAAYGNAGGSVELHKFAGQPHSFIKEPVGAAGLEALGFMTRFVLKQASRIGV
jgi:acetyl esterase